MHMQSTFDGAAVAVPTVASRCPPPIPGTLAPCASERLHYR